MWPLMDPVPDWAPASSTTVNEIKIMKRIVRITDPRSPRPHPRANPAWVGGREPSLPNLDLRLLTGLEHSPSAHGFPPGAVLSLSFVLPELFHELACLKSVEKSSACKVLSSQNALEAHIREHTMLRAGYRRTTFPPRFDMICRRHSIVHIY